MRHLRKGRVLGRSPSHRKALFRNLASAIFLTERDTTELEANAPKVPGRIITTLEKAKEIRPIVERCITIACKGIEAEAGAVQYATKAERGTEEWKSWRKSDAWRQWCDARSPGVNARRRVLRMLGDKQAVSILFEKVAPRFTDRPGGYTRILRLAKPRVGDAGTRAILEFVGKNDRVRKASSKPSFEG
ncbi:MAG: L17 family ribosomal protein [Planctomycetota bacterium]|jgi:large subunit ribosomal protein L17